MAQLSAKTKMMHWRRGQVADRLRAGWSQREMALQLNVSLGTINRDVAVITQHWRDAANVDVAVARGQQLADLRAVKAKIWRSGGHAGGKEHARILLQCIRLEAQITGTLKPAPFVSVTNNVSIVNVLAKAIADSGLSQTEAVAAFEEIFRGLAERKQLEVADDQAGCGEDVGVTSGLSV